MSDKHKSTIYGVLLFILSFSLGALFIWLEYSIYESMQLKQECEAEMPRDKHCIMEFIPDDE